MQFALRLKIHVDNVLLSVLGMMQYIYARNEKYGFFYPIRIISPLLWYNTRGIPSIKSNMTFLCFYANAKCNVVLAP